MIETTATGQIIDYGQIPLVNAATSFTVLTWFNLYSLANWEGGANGVIVNNYDSTLANGWSFTTENSVTRLYFLSKSGGGVVGQWYISSPGINALKHVAITYNGSSTSNDPIIYVNGSSVSVTKAATPSGALLLTNCELSLFNRNDAGIAKTQTLKGALFSVCVYNYIMSASEVSDAYNSKLAIPSWRGLIFAPQLWNVQDGAVLGSSNIIRDLVSGAAGVPSGSPVGRGDNVLRIEGIN